MRICKGILTSMHQTHTVLLYVQQIPMKDNCITFTCRLFTKACPLNAQRLTGQFRCNNLSFDFAQVSTLFDNEGTVAFAMFMAVWGKI